MNVTFINPGKQGERFWDMVTETMTSAANDLDVDLEVVYAQRSRSKMISLGQEITRRVNPPNYLILVNEEQSADTIFLATIGTNIKTLMLLNDFLPNQRARVGFPTKDNSSLIGSLIPDNYAAGYRQMQALYQCIEQNSKANKHHMLAIGGDKITPASIDRNFGAISFIDQKMNIVLDRFLYANWEESEAKNITESYLKWAAKGDIQPAGIWAANDPIATGVLTALKEANLEAGSDVCLVGLNWSLQGLKLVKSGEMVATDGGHFLAGAWAIVVLFDYHQRTYSGDTRPIGRINFQMMSINKTNVDLYLEELGDEDWSKIDFKGFALKPKQNYQEYDFTLMNVIKQIRTNSN